MIESSILIVCDEPTTSRIWALCVIELYRRPVAANSIEHSITPIHHESHALEAYQVISREGYSVE
jgi:hypothetical protein